MGNKHDDVIGNTSNNISIPQVIENVKIGVISDKKISSTILLFCVRKVYLYHSFLQVYNFPLRFSHSQNTCVKNQNFFCVIIF